MSSTPLCSLPPWSKKQPVTTTGVRCFRSWAPPGAGASLSPKCPTLRPNRGQKSLKSDKLAQNLAFLSILGTQKGPKSVKMYQKLTFLSIFGAPGHPKTRVLASVFRWENLFSFVLAAISPQNRTKSIVKHEVSSFSKQVKPCILRVQTLFFNDFLSRFK